MIKQFTFEVQQFVHTQLISDDKMRLSTNQVRVQSEYIATHAAHALRTLLSLPGQKLPRTLVAQYPATWWDHIKQRLGFKHESVSVFRQDVAVFPKLELPARVMGGCRTFTIYQAEPFNASYRP